MTPAGSATKNLRSALDAGAALPARVGVVCSLYDTGFEDLAQQVQSRSAQLRDALAPFPELAWTLLVVNDSEADQTEQAAAIDAGFAALEDKPESARLERLDFFGPAGIDRKGAAIRRGFRHLLDGGDDPPAELLAYINLNLKVDLAQLPIALAPFLDPDVDVVIATRAPKEGGGVVGAGALGRLKSIVYNRMARLALPPLAPFSDTNAPLKIGRAAAIDHLLRVARVEDVSFDTEWVLAFVEGGFRIEKAPVVWKQRAGSRPPWGAIPRVVASLRDQRRRWRSGEFSV